MPDQTVTVKAYHPYPTFYWEYKLAGGQADTIENYAAYTRADNSDPANGHDQRTVAINATVADVGQIRCTVGRQKPKTNSYIQHRTMTVGKTGGESVGGLPGAAVGNIDPLWWGSSDSGVNTYGFWVTSSLIMKFRSMDESQWGSETSMRVAFDNGTRVFDLPWATDPNNEYNIPVVPQSIYDYLDANVGQDIQFTITPGSKVDYVDPNPPQPGEEGTVTTEWISVSVGALEWEVNPESKTETIRTIPWQGLVVVQNDDGKAYFSNPDGVVATVADYAELRALGSASSSPVGVTAERYAGTFDYTPNAFVEDGGIIINSTADSGSWIRRVKNTQAEPLDLGWFESVVTDFDVAPLMHTLAAQYQPDSQELHFRCPAENLTIAYGDPLTVWTDIYTPLRRFTFVESPTHTTRLEFTDPTQTQNWHFSELNELIIGSAVKKPSDQYNLTFVGSWTPTNRLVNDGAGTANAHHMIKNTTPVWSVGDPTIFRCNSEAPQSVVFQWVSSDRLVPPSFQQVFLGGTHKYGGAAEISGGHEGATCTYEDWRGSDELMRRLGWTGTAEGNGTAAMGHQRGSGVGAIGSMRLFGNARMRYGGALMAILFADDIGTAEEPFDYVMEDYGHSGPNPWTETGLWEPGVTLTGTGYALMNLGKTDGLGIEEPGHRFLNLTYLGAEPNSWQQSGWITESDQRDDNNNAPDTHSTWCIYTASRIWGNWVGFMTGTGNTIAHNTLQGDGSNYCIQFRAEIYDDGTLRNAKVGYVILMYQAPAGSTFHIDDVTVDHHVTRNSPEFTRNLNIEVNRLYFGPLGGSRVGIYVHKDQQWVINDLAFADGDVITIEAAEADLGAATMTLNGTPIDLGTLPYTVKLADWTLPERPLEIPPAYVEA